MIGFKKEFIFLHIPRTGGTSIESFLQPHVEFPDQETNHGQLKHYPLSKYYEVFARKDSHSELSHVGSVEAPNDQLAQVRAWYIYDQHKWKEMCVVPLEAIITVTEEGKSAKIKMA